MTKTITLPLDFIACATLCASTEKARYYLNGVYLDNVAGAIVATDGHRMFVGKAPQLRELTSGIIVPGAAIAAAAKAAGRKASTVDIEIDARGAHWLVTGTSRIFFEPIDGTFPDWTRALPAAIKRETPARFNPNYYHDIGKMAKLLGCGIDGAEVHQNATGPCGITFGDRDDCCAAIMPVRRSGRSWTGFATA